LDAGGELPSFDPVGHGGGAGSIDKFMTEFLPQRTMRIPKIYFFWTNSKLIASGTERDHSAPRLASTRWVTVIA